MDFLVLTDIHNNWVHLEKMLSLASELDGVIFLGDLMPFNQVDSEALENFSRIHDATNFAVGVPGNGALPEVVQYFHDIGINVHGKSRIVDEVGFFGVGCVSDTVNLILELRSFFKDEMQDAIELNERSIKTLSFFGISIRDDVFVVEAWTGKQVRELERYRSPYEHSEEQIHNILAQGFQTVLDCPIQILLSHVPPYEQGLNPNLPDGVSTGSKSITRFVEEHQPSLVLSGHYHLFHEFTINSIPCSVLPAVKDGYYSILRTNLISKSQGIKVEIF